MNRAAALPAAICCFLAAGAGLAGAKDHPDVVVLGFDGMDYGVTRDLIAAGELPAFARLARAGSFIPLGTSLPPQSPVAWSNCITGMNPGGHGIFDFIARDPKTYLPYLSTTTSSGGEGKSVSLGDWVFPLSGGKVELEREGHAFWEVLSDAGVPCRVSRIPSNYPPVECEAYSLSGMGTPDILGTYGTFLYYTSERGQAGEAQGGRVYEVQPVNYVIRTALPGPNNPFRKGNPPSESEFTVYLDPKNPVAKIVLGGQEVMLNQGEWSGWMKVEYELAPWQTLHGICRFLLRQVRPDFQLYVTPVNLDPANPALPISTPPEYASDMAREIGPFYTETMPEDTWALDEGRLTDEEFLHQTGFVVEESWKILDFELDRYRDGFLFFYFSTTDLMQHMFWRAIDPEHPGYTPELAAAHGDAIRRIYREADRVLAHVLDRVGPDATVMVMSDHGFGSFRQNFHLNAWLRQEGYLRFLDEAREEHGEFFQGVDWSRTRAYAAGLNGLFINLRGREGKGIVNPGPEAEKLIREIAAKLEAVRDPRTGAPVVAKAYLTSEEYSGANMALAPDIVPGYGLPYRASWETALGKTPAELFGDNTKKWTGDHCTDPRQVPGILLCNRPLESKEAALVDVAPTLLAIYGHDPLPEMVGKPLLGGARADARREGSGG